MDIASLTQAYKVNEYEVEINASNRGSLATVVWHTEGEVEKTVGITHTHNNTTYKLLTLDFSGKDLIYSVDGFIGLYVGDKISVTCSEKADIIITIK